MNLKWSVQLYWFKSFLVAAMLSTGIAATADSNNIDKKVFDSFKDCAFSLRYDESKKKFDAQLPGLSSNKKLVTVKDGYATIHVRAVYHGLRISQMVVPTTTNTFLQYQLRIEAQPARVRRTLQRTWNVRFTQPTSDGMDNKVGSASTMLESAAQASVFADSEKSKTTILECNP
jgi:hypothetical protein